MFFEQRLLYISNNINKNEKILKNEQRNRDAAGKKRATVGSQIYASKNILRMFHYKVACVFIYAI